MGKISAGLLLYRRRDDVLEVLLVHPGGPFWQNKDRQAWSLPKGEPEPGEALRDAALREFTEETGLPAGVVTGEPFALAPQRQSGGKTVHAWAAEGDCDPAQIASNSFTMEWPPRSGRTASFPEVDKAAWFSLEAARDKLHGGQVPLLDELAQRLAAG